MLVRGDLFWPVIAALMFGTLLALVTVVLSLEGVIW